MENHKKSNQEIIENAIAGGLLGAALGALLTGKNKTTIAAAIVGAAIGASLQAIEKAKKLKTPVLYEEDGFIIKVYPNGKKEIVKKVERLKIDVPTSFTIE